MNDTLAAAKAAMRTEVRGRVAALSEEQRRSAAAAVVVRLQSQDIWQRAGAVLLFAPLRDELDVWPLLSIALAAGKQVGLPAFNSGTRRYEARRIRDPQLDLVVGQFGIREPAELSPEMDLNPLDLVLVPGLAFDARGGRLGRGKGFYDRLLAEVRGTKCGVAFDEQLVGAVPVGPLDIPLNCIVTPSRWIET